MGGSQNLYSAGTYGNFNVEDASYVPAGRSYHISEFHNPLNSILIHGGYAVNGWLIHLCYTKKGYSQVLWMIYGVLIWILINGPYFLEVI